MNSWAPGSSWGAGPAAVAKYLALVAEDHSYTFKTTEQRHQRLPDGRVYDPNAHLPYGPEKAAA